MVEWKKRNFYRNLNWGWKTKKLCTLLPLHCSQGIGILLKIEMSEWEERKFYKTAGVHGMRWGWNEMNRDRLQQTLSLSLTITAHRYECIEWCHFIGLMGMLCG